MSLIYCISCCLHVFAAELRRSFTRLYKQQVRALEYMEAIYISALQSLCRVPASTSISKCRDQQLSVVKLTCHSSRLIHSWWKVPRLARILPPSQPPYRRSVGLPGACILTCMIFVSRDCVVEQVNRCLINRQQKNIRVRRNEIARKRGVH